MSVSYPPRPRVSSSIAELFAKVSITSVLGRWFVSLCKGWNLVNLAPIARFHRSVLSVNLPGFPPYGEEERRGSPFSDQEAGLSVGCLSPRSIQALPTMRPRVGAIFLVSKGPLCPWVPHCPRTNQVQGKNALFLLYKKICVGTLCQHPAESRRSPSVQNIHILHGMRPLEAQPLVLAAAAATDWHAYHQVVQQ